MTDQLKDNIIRAIQKGEVTMRPKWHFVLRSALVLLGVLVTALGLLFISSFVLFLLRASGVFFIPLFGFPGIRAFLFALPWLLLLFTILFVVVLEILARFYGFGRRLPLLYSALAIIAFVFIATVVIGKTAFHERMNMRAMDGRLPIMGEMYRNFPKPQDVHRGRVVEMTPSGFVLTHRNGPTTSVILLPETRLPHKDVFVEGDIVVVFGKKDTGTVTALGVLKVDEERFDPRRAMKQRESIRSLSPELKGITP